MLKNNAPKEISSGGNKTLLLQQFLLGLNFHELWVTQLNNSISWKKFVEVNFKEEE